MIAETKHPPLRLLAVVLAAALLFTACAGGAKSKADQLELGRKYLTEMNYSEAIAAFTEAIKLNPDDIEAYLGRAEAYAAMGEYEKALADYDTVLEKAGDDPYTQAQAYAGRAGVDEQADQPEDAERDYTAALTQLDKDTDQQDADAVLTLKKDVLIRHAAVCITLALLDKAADDYDALEQLGENVAAKRKELESLLPDTGTSPDAENGLTPDAPDTDTPADADTPADTGTEPEAPAEEEQPASSKEEPAESKQTETPVVQEAKSYTATETYEGGNTDDDTITYTEKVTYQIGGNTLKISSSETEAYSYGTEADAQHKETESSAYTYTLSQPLQGMERHGEWQVVWDVPAGTTITCGMASSFVRDGETISSDSIQNYPMWYVVSDRILKDYQDVQNQIAATGDLSKESITVEKGNFYVLITMGEGGETLEKGGFIFRGV